MTRERPLSVFILGLLNLLVGVLFLFAGVAKAGRFVLSLVLGPGQRDTMYFGNSRDQNVPIPDLESYLDLEIPGYATWEIGAVIVTILAGLVVFAIGYGLLHMRPWACGLAVVYAVAIFLWQIAYTLFQVREVLPVAEVYFLDESWRMYFWMPNTLDLARKSFLFFAWCQVILLVGHAALVLAVLWLPSVRAAFRGQPDLTSPAPALVPGAAPGSV